MGAMLASGTGSQTTSGRAVSGVADSIAKADLGWGKGARLKKDSTGGVAMCRVCFPMEARKAGELEARCLSKGACIAANVDSRCFWASRLRGGLGGGAEYLDSQSRSWPLSPVGAGGLTSDANQGDTRILTISQKDGKDLIYK